MKDGNLERWTSLVTIPGPFRKEVGGMLAITLGQCLEHVATLGTDYLLTAEAREWTAAELLASLASGHSDRLELPMYLRLPDLQRDGAICQITETGAFSSASAFATKRPTDSERLLSRYSRRVPRRSSSPHSRSCLSQPRKPALHDSNYYLA